MGLSLPADWRGAAAALVAAATLATAAAGCPGRCGSTGTDQKEGPWPTASPAIDRVPAEAESAFFLRHLRDLGAIARFGTDRLPEGATDGWLPADLGLSSLPQSVPLGKFGLAPDRTTALYCHAGRWGLVIPIADKKHLDKRLPDLVDATPLTLADPPENPSRRLLYQSTPVATLRIRSDHLIVRQIAARGRAAGAKSDAAPDPPGVEPTWPSGKAERKLLDELASDDARLIGVAEPKRWFPDGGASGAGGIALQRLAHQ
ncbi:MAG: hypothetical protein ABEN55_05950, partial [Bradymonadaceae bacterium]